MLTISDVRKRVPVSRPTIYALMDRADFPKGEKIPGRGNKLWWKPEAVDAWAKAHGYDA